MAELFINLTQLRRLLGNDDGMVVQFLEIFKEEIPVQLEGIRHAIHIHDWPTISQLAHGIKSQVKYLDLQDLAELARTIEELAEREKSTEEIPGLFNRLESGLTEVMERL